MIKMPVQHSNAIDPNSKPAEWVRRMHAYREQTGAFRDQDILRVLGNQRSGAGLDDLMRFDAEKRSKVKMAKS